MDSSKQNTVVHISEIPNTVKEADIKQYFKDKLDVEVRVGTMRPVKNKEIPLQWARVDFRTPEAYNKAIEELRFPAFAEGVTSRLLPNDREIIAKDIAEKNVFVKGLDKMKYDNEELYDLFKQFGEIDASKISKTIKKDDANKFTVESNGYGFIKFNEKEKAKEVLEKAKLEDPNIVVEPYLKEKKQTQANNLYVKNFSDEVDEDVLRKLFEKYGEIRSVKVMKDENLDKKFGFVCFNDAQAATDALEMNEAAIEPYSDCLYVTRHEKKSVRREALQKAYKKQNLYVRNFGEDVTEKDLKDLFSQFGPIKNVKLLTKRTEINGEVKELSQCKGFVCFEFPEDAKRAVDESKEKGIWFDAKRLNVSLFEPRSERETHKGAGNVNPEINDFIMNFLQSMSQGGMMGGMNFMGAPPVPPVPGHQGRGGYQGKPNQPPRGPRADMYAQRPPHPGMGGGFPPNPNPNFGGQNMMNPGMPMMGQPGGYDNQMKMPPTSGMGGMMPSQNRGPMPPINAISEDGVYANQYNECVNNAEYQQSGDDEKRNKLGDLIFPYVERAAGGDAAPKITGMIIDLEIQDLEQSTASLASLNEKIREGMNLLQEENEE